MPIRPEYIYRWNRQGRKGQRCVVLARGTMNSCLVEFADDYTMVTSRNAIKKAPEVANADPARAQRADLFACTEVS